MQRYKQNFANLMNSVSVLRKLQETFYYLNLFNLQRITSFTGFPEKRDQTERIAAGRFQRHLRQKISLRSANRRDQRRHFSCSR